MIRPAFAAFGLMAALLCAGSPRAGAADLLENGNFEEGAVGWSSNAGQLDAVSSPVYAGALSGRFVGGSQPTTQFVYQWVSVRPNENYDLSGWIAASGGDLKRVFLRVSWYDADGQLLIEWDSDWLPQFDGAFHRLATGTHVSLSAARSARVSAVVQADSVFTVHLDDFGLAGPVPAPPPPSTPTPHITAAPTVAPTVPPPTATSTPSPEPRPRPSKTPVPTRPATPGTSPSSPPGEPVEPPAFPSLVNGGFEELRNDGTPYGWHKQGGEITSAAEPRTGGSRSLALNSQTSSTKWAYQTVSVTAGAYYQASVDTYAGEGTDAAFLRVSWYGSTDGSGTALGSDDSTASAKIADGTYRRLATVTVQAPVGAASAKIRLMLRPQSNEPAVAYFDAASFSHAAPGAEEVVLGPARGGSSNVGGSAPGRSAGDAPETSPAAAGTPVRLVNAKPAVTPGPIHAAAASGGSEGWAIALAIGIAIAAVAIAGGYELWQQRVARGRRGTLSDE